MGFTKVFLVDGWGWIGWLHGEGNGVSERLVDWLAWEKLIPICLPAYASLGLDLDLVT